MPNKFWTIQMKKMTNETGGEETVGEILIYGAVVEDNWWDDSEVTPFEFAKDLKALDDVKNIHVHINSYGGDVSAGSAIYSLLKQHQARVTVRVDGFALSAASVIAMAGDVVIMPGNAMMMIHNPAIRTYGDAAALRKNAETLDKVRNSMTAVYCEKTGLSREEIIAMLDAETWFTANEAVGKGFADVEEAPLLAVACAGNGMVAMNGREFDLSKGFRNIPQSLRKIMESEDKNLTVKNNAQTVPAPIETAPAPMNTPQVTASAQNAQNTPLDVEAIRAEARQEGIAAERKRQREIDDLAIPGMEAVIAKAKYETGDAPEAVALAIVKAQKQAGQTAFSERREDAALSGVNELNAAVTGDGMGSGSAANEASAALGAEIMKGRDKK
ncbi:MAG: ATP-dependent Clp protease proteolytic subunit [Synergistaceae bacterium]|jgi:ATP-dependent protease ClpP protease subunit|nr:ATP-dependent Clp protease proteolytic subunit [Synergistaceae bacterium]